MNTIIKLRFTLLPIMLFILCGCVPSNIVHGYNAKMKSIEPGFHMLGSHDNTYRLKYVGEPDSTIDSAKEIWLKRASQICVNTRNSAKVTDKKISEGTKTKYKQVSISGGFDNPVSESICIMGGLIGCLLAEIISTNKVSTISIKGESKDIKYPEIVGTIDCEPRQYESNQSLQSDAPTARR